MTAANEWAEVYGTWEANAEDVPRGRSGVRSDAGEHGPYRGFGRSKGRNPDGPSTPDYGLTVAELVRYQRAFTEFAANRLRGVGAEQYDRGGKQKFEDMAVRDLVHGLREELADIINYAVFLDVQVNRWAEHWESMVRKAEARG